MPRTLTLHVPAAAIAALLVVTGKGLAIGQSEDDQERIASQLERMPAVMDSGGVPGIGLAILDANEIVWQDGFGVRAENDPAPVGMSREGPIGGAALEPSMRSAPSAGPTAAR